MRIGSFIRAVFLASVLFGCGPRPVPPGYAGPSVLGFVAENRGPLFADVQRGSGEVIYELAKIAGCQDVSALGRALHQKRAEIFAAPTPDTGGAPERVLAILSSTPELRCVDLDLSQQRSHAAGRRRVLGPRSRPRALYWGRGFNRSYQEPPER